MKKEGPRPTTAKKFTRVPLQTPRGPQFLFYAANSSLAREKGGVKMDFERFKKEMALAETMAKTDVERENYWRGYQRGLRRAYHGDKFGTIEEHQKYLEAVNSPDEGRRETGRGYADALQDWGKP